MKYNLIVEGFGKIKSAKICISPLTLLVGDNNSGKSYLLSLIWALQGKKGSTSQILYQNLMNMKSEEFKRVWNQIQSFIPKTDIDNLKISFRTKDFEQIINELMNMNKDRFVRGIFNYQDIKIEKLQIEFLEDEDIILQAKREESIISLYIKEHQIIGYSKDIFFEDNNRLITSIVIQSIIETLLNAKYNIYFPAARTGFMLAKDVINKVSRQKAFDVIEFQQDELPKMQPFTKPIVEFLNEMEDLNIDYEGKFIDIAMWIEKNMTHGTVQYNETAKKELRYKPQGQQSDIPLRATSAIVTELSPLIMLLKYGMYINQICYEEPEMCLHPELQLKMAILLIKMVNNGLSIVATTHSDIILQHINNMCKVYSEKIPEEYLEQYGLSADDAIDAEKISIYQFHDEGEYSTVERILYKDGEFCVPSFCNALLNILNITSEIQNFEKE